MRLNRITTAILLSTVSFSASAEGWGFDDPDPYTYIGIDLDQASGNTTLNLGFALEDWLAIDFNGVDPDHHKTTLFGHWNVEGYSVSAGVYSKRSDEWTNSDLGWKLGMGHRFFHDKLSWYAYARRAHVGLDEIQHRDDVEGVGGAQEQEWWELTTNTNIGLGLVYAVHERVDLSFEISNDEMKYDTWNVGNAQDPYVIDEKSVEYIQDHAVTFGVQWHY